MDRKQSSHVTVVGILCRHASQNAFSRPHVNVSDSLWADSLLAARPSGSEWPTRAIQTILSEANNGSAVRGCEGEQRLPDVTTDPPPATSFLSLIFYFLGLI